jgi:hypothetical protein
MIQRIQSLYLLLTTIASSLFLTGGYLSLVNSSGYEAIVRFSGVYVVSSGGGYGTVIHLFPVPVISVLVPVIAAVTILLFKNRKLQKQITLLNIFLELILIISAVILLMPVVENNSAILKPGYRIILPLLSLAFLVMAYIGIKKDDKLVKSYDRIR